MFSKSIGIDRREPELPEVVAICDHLFFFSSGQLKEKIVRKPGKISFYSLIKSLCSSAKNEGQVRIQHNTFVPYQQDGSVDFPG